MISSDSSDESVGSSSSRIILFGTILTEIPTETHVIPPVAPEAETARVASPAGVLDLITYSSTDSNTSEDLPSPEHVSTIPATLPFLRTDSFEAFDSDSSDRPLSLDSHETVLPPAVRQRVPASPEIPRRSSILVLLGQEIPLGRPYRTQPNGVLKMLTTRKRVHPYPARVPVNHRRFCSSPSSSPRKRRRSSSSSLSSDSPPATTTIDCKRCRSLTTSVPSAIPDLGALSPTYADLLPLRKRFRSSSARLSIEASIEGSIEI
ncbi:hypothetical protein Tco_1372272, partial [Tanacetum coccineum]